MAGIASLVIGVFVFALIGVVALLVRTGGHSDWLRANKTEIDLLKNHAALQEKRIAVLERAFQDAGLQIPGGRQSPPLPAPSPQPDVGGLPPHLRPHAPPPITQTPLWDAQAPAAPAPLPREAETPSPAADAARQAPSPPEDPAEAQSPAPPSLNKTFRSFIKGGNLWVAAGVLLLFAAFGLLLSYMAQRGLFTIEMRIAAAIAGGLAMLVFGWKFRQKKPVYALVIQGGGIGVLYLSFFAASKLTGLLPPPAALVFVSLLVPATVTLALLQNAQALAVFGLLGGFAAPILLSTGSGNYAALFSYYLILDLAVLIIGHFRLWRVLNLCAAVCTFAVALIWVANRYQPEMFAGVQPFMLAYILLFTFIGIRPARGAKIPPRTYVDLPITLGTPFLAALIQWRIFSYIDHGLAIVCIAFSAFYLLLAWTIWKKRGPGVIVLAEGYLALAALLANLAIPLELSSRATSAVWAAEGLLVYLFGCRRGSRPLRITAHIFHAAAVIAFIAQTGHFGAYPAFRGPLFSGGLIIALSAIATAILGGRQRKNPADRAAPLAAASAAKATPFFFAAWGLLFWFCVWDAEFNRAFETPQAWFFLCVSLTSLAAFAAGKFFRSPALYLGLAAAPLLALYTTAGLILPRLTRNFPHSFPDILTVNFFRIPYLWGWLVFFASQAFLLIKCSPAKLLPPEDAGVAGEMGDMGENALSAPLRDKLQKAHAWWAFAVVLVAVLALGCSGRAAAQHLGLAPSWKSLAGILPSLACVTALSLLSRRPCPQAHTQALFIWIPRLLCLATSIWFAATLFAPGSPSPLPFYIPLINPLELQQAFCIALILLRQLSLRKAGLGPVFKTRTLFVLVDGMAFLWLTAMVARSAHFFLGIPLSRVPSSGQFQLALLILWGIFGISHILAGHKKNIRPLWLAGAFLMAIDIAKLLLIDLARTQTITRIISFFVAGLLLLFIGWAAPLPPRETHPPNKDQ
ncbi:MAG: DUF2339 domain-containing protein [Spirochaetia bacterium]|jgi:uncharacterized membrane protein|nr:DUF2339 domain-containing protein [Spirochaetia bacterium]